jgi:hypothetical protein
VPFRVNGVNVCSGNSQRETTNDIIDELKEREDD